MTLPAKFPSGTVFADVEGVPASRTPDMECTAWDVPSGRRFNGASFSHNGTLVSEPKFRELADAVTPTEWWKVVRRTHGG
jgi:hypothetical protein